MLTEEEVSNIKSNCKEYIYPRPHLIIKDFLPKRILDSFLNELKSYEDDFKLGTSYINNENIYDKERKYCLNFEPRDRTKPILSFYDNDFWPNKELQSIFNTQSGAFESIQFCNFDYTKIIAYKKGHYYRWHSDNMKDGLIVTLLYLSQPNKTYKGGELVLRNKDDVKTIPFENNMFIVSLRSTEHMVTELKSETKEFMDCRFVIQHWPHIIG